MHIYMRIHALWIVLGFAVSYVLGFVTCLRVVRWQRDGQLEDVQAQAKASLSAKLLQQAQQRAQR